MGQQSHRILQKITLGSSKASALLTFPIALLIKTTPKPHLGAENHPGRKSAVTKAVSPPHRPAWRHRLVPGLLQRSSNWLPAPSLQEPRFRTPLPLSLPYPHPLSFIWPPEPRGWLHTHLARPGCSHRCFRFLPSSILTTPLFSLGKVGILSPMIPTAGCSQQGAQLP